MGKIQKPLKIKLFVGMIANSGLKITEAEKILAKKFGAADFESPVIPFTFTDYYGAEIGQNLLRKWVSFKKLADPEELSKIKTQTNSIEDKFSKQGKRSAILTPVILPFQKWFLLQPRISATGFTFLKEYTPR